MKAANNRQLVDQIMRLNSPMMSAGGSGASFFGGPSSKQQALVDLKKLALEFAAETQKAKSDPAKITDLTNQIEASLRTLYALNIVDQRKMDDLLNLLHS